MSDRKVVLKVEDGMDRRDIYATTYQMRVPYKQFSDAVANELDVFNYSSLSRAADLAPKGGRVLDMCCGRGLLIPMLRYRLRNPSLYVGVDISPSNAKWKDGADPRKPAKEEQTADWGFPTVFVESSVAEMAEPVRKAAGEDVKFDFIAYTSSIEHMQPEAQQASLHEAKKLAADDATLYLTCPVTPEHQDGYAAQYAAHIYEPKISELKAWLQAAGWSVTRTLGLSTKVSAISEVFGAQGSSDDADLIDRIRRDVPRAFALPMIAYLYPETATEIGLICTQGHSILSSLDEEG